MQSDAEFYLLHLGRERWDPLEAIDKLVRIYYFRLIFFLSILNGKVAENA